MARTFDTLEELRSHRAERERLFQQAVEMHKAGELTDDELAMVERKHRKRLSRLERTEQEMLTAEAEAEAEVEVESIAPISVVDEGLVVPALNAPSLESALDSFEPDELSEDIAEPTKDEDPEWSWSAPDWKFAKASETPADESGDRSGVALPSERDLEILTSTRGTPEGVSMPRPSEIKIDHSYDEEQSDELSHIKELYGRELFAKEQLEKRLRSETEAKRELSQQVLELTRVKDLAHAKSHDMRTALGKWKRNVVYLVIACSLCLAVIVYGLWKQHQLATVAEQQGKANAVARSDAEHKFEEARERAVGLEKSLADFRSDLTSREKELVSHRAANKRLRERLSEVSTGTGAERRTRELLVVQYARLLKENPKQDGEELLGRLAESLSKDKEALRDEVAQFAATPKGALAQGLAAVLQGRNQASLPLLDTAIAQREVLLKDLLALTAHVATSAGAPAGQQLAYLRSASSLAPGDLRIAEQLAETFVNVGKLDEAMAVFERLLVSGQAGVPFALRIGFLLERKGRLPEAGTVYRKALERFATDRGLLTALAGVEMESFRFDQAKVLLEKALAEGTGSGNIGLVHFNLANACLGLQQVERAKEHCVKAKELGQDVFDVETRLASQGK